jgi:hypothetical protein
MKITANFSRKVGLPGYSSVGAHCTIETDTKSTDPETVAALIRAAYELATRAVDDQLVAYQGEQARGDLAEEGEPEPEPEPARNRSYSQRLDDRKRAGGDGNYDPDRPRNGRQLLAMLRRLEEAGADCSMNDLTRYAKLHDLPSRITEWEEEDARAGATYLLGLANRKPEPAGRNGHAGRNGRTPF